MKTRRSMVAVLATVAGTTSAMAQTATWNGSNADWDTNNWIWSPNGAGFPDSALNDAVQNSGNLNLRTATSFTVRDFTINGGNLTGDGTLIVSRAFNLVGGSAAGSVTIKGLGGSWSGGHMNNGQTTTIDTTGSWDISAGLADMNGHVIVNNGVVTHSAGTIRSGSTTLQNNGLWDENGVSDTTINNAYGAWTFRNNASGTLRRSAAATTSFNTYFENFGLAEATDGVLNFNSGGIAQNGSRFKATGSGILNINNTYTFDGLVTFEGDGLVQISGGAMQGTSTFAGTSLKWTGGSFNSAATTTIASGAKFEIQAGTADFSAHNFVNEGTIVHSAGTMRGGSGGSISNKSLWLETSANDNQINRDYGNWTYTNEASATFRKNAASTTTVVATFDNAGLAEAQQGSLLFAGGGTASEGARFKASGSGVINFSSNYTFSGNVYFEGDSKVSITGGTMFGDHTLNGQNLRWIGGTFNSAGTTTIPVGSAFEIASGPSDFAARTFMNFGTINRTNGDMRGNQDSSVVNHGTWNELNGNNQSMNSAYGGSWAFNNAVDGVIRKTSNSVTQFDGGGRLDNSGLVDVQDGVFNIYAGGQSTDGARFKASGPGIINFSSYQFNDNVKFEGDSVIRIVAGTQTGNHTLNGVNMQWVGGNFNSAGTTTLAVGSQLLISQGNADFAGRAFVNKGLMTHDQGAFRGNGSSSLSNRGVWSEVGAAATDINAAFGGTWTFTNETDGTFVKDSGAATFISSGVRLQNNGLVDVKNGTLNINGSGSNGEGGRFRVASSGALNFNGYSFAGNVFFDGTGFADFTGGTFDGDHTFNGTNLRWLGGNFNNAGTSTVAFGSKLNIVAGNADMANRTLVNNGVIDHTNGSVRGNGNSGISNHGTWNEIAAAGADINAAFGGVWTFTNETDGVLVKNSDAPSTFANGVRLQNNGLVDVQKGPLVVNGGGSNGEGGRYRASSNGSLSINGYSFAGNAFFEGTGNVDLSGGVFDGTHTFHGTNLRWTGGNFSTAGTTTIAPDGALSILAGAADMASRTISNFGVVSHGTGQIRGNGGSNIDNSGLWLDGKTGGSDFNAVFGGTWTFKNKVGGEFRKEGGANTGFFSVAMENAGLIDVREGTMIFNGGFHQTAGRTQLNQTSITSNAPLLFDGGELGGSGTINQSVLMNNGWLTPGSSPGLIAITGNLTFSEPAALLVDLDGHARGTEYDAVNVNGSVTLGNAALYGFVGLNGLATIQIGDVFEILTRTSAGPILGTFKDLPEGGTLIVGHAFEVQISYIGGSGNDVTLTVTREVPAPGAIAAFAVGGLVGLKRRRRA